MDRSSCTFGKRNHVPWLNNLSATWNLQENGCLYYAQSPALTLTLDLSSGQKYLPALMWSPLAPYWTKGYTQLGGYCRFYNLLVRRCITSFLNITYSKGRRDEMILSIHPSFTSSIRPSVRPFNHPFTLNGDCPRRTVEFFLQSCLNLGELHGLTV